MRLRLIAAIVVTVVTVLAACACRGSSDAVTIADGKTVLRYQGWMRTAQNLIGKKFGMNTLGAVRNGYLRKNRDAVADFTQGTARAIRWAQVTPRAAVIAKFKQIITARGRNESTDEADYWKSTGVAGTGGVIAEKKIQLWIDWLARSGEPAAGKLTAKSLYTREFNPYANGTYREGAGPDGQAIAK